MKELDNYKLVSVNDAAKLMAISRRTVERLVSAGDLPRPVKIGKSSRFRIRDIINYIENSYETPSKKKKILDEAKLSHYEKSHPLLHGVCI